MLPHSGHSRPVSRRNGQRMGPWATCSLIQDEATNGVANATTPERALGPTTDSRTRNLVPDALALVTGENHDAAYKGGDAD